MLTVDIYHLSLHIHSARHCSKGLICADPETLQSGYFTFIIFILKMRKLRHFEI